MADPREQKSMEQIMKPLLRLSMKVSVPTLEAYVKYIQALINLRKSTGGTA